MEIFIISRRWVEVFIIKNFCYRNLECSECERKFRSSEVWYEPPPPILFFPYFTYIPLLLLPLLHISPSPLSSLISPLLSPLLALLVLLLQLVHPFPHYPAPALTSPLVALIFNYFPSTSYHLHLLFLLPLPDFSSLPIISPCYPHQISTYFPPHIPCFTTTYSLYFPTPHFHNLPSFILLSLPSFFLLSSAFPPLIFPHFP